VLNVSPTFPVNANRNEVLSVNSCFGGFPLGPDGHDAFGEGEDADHEAKKGDAVYQWFVGRAYAIGEGVPQDYKEQRPGVRPAGGLSECPERLIHGDPCCFC
jgi:hypothetical protein